MPERSRLTIACEPSHKEDMMSVATADPTARATTVRDHDTADRDRKPDRSRIWALLGALAYAGALIDPTGVLATQRFARIREDAQRRGLW
jgi:hypothetical protein